MKYLITGGCGFLGSNIAAKIVRQNLGSLSILDNLSRQGAFENKKWIESQGEFRFEHCDIANPNDVSVAMRASKPDVIFHLAGQVAMTTSLANPRRDFEVNALGTFNILEAVRQHCPESAVLYSSTNKVYGDLEWVRFEEQESRYVAVDYPHGFSEKIPLDFHSPYGCSKGAADQYVLDYHRMFGLKTVVFRHSSMYGERQFATYDQGWIGWFCSVAANTKKQQKPAPFTISGNGKQVRDLLYVDDIVALYLLASERMNKVEGRAFNVGGGVDNSFSLLELFDTLEKELGTTLRYEALPPRESDQKVFIADIGKIKDAIGWTPKVNKNDGVRKMVRWVEAHG